MSIFYMVMGLLCVALAFFMLVVRPSEDNVAWGRIFIAIAIVYSVGSVTLSKLDEIESKLNAPTEQCEF
jgi:hypothetical protein